MKKCINREKLAVKAVNDDNNKHPKKEQKHYGRDVEALFANSPYVDEYFDVFSSTNKIITKNFLLRFGKEIVEWAQANEDAFKLSEFYLSKGISSSKFEKWCAKDEEFRSFVDIALEILGNRREKLTLKKVLDAGTVNFMMPMYDKKWKEMHQWRAKLKAESEVEQNKPTVIVLDKLVKDN